MKTIVTCFLLLLASVSFSQEKISAKDIASLKKLMTGTFSSSAQAVKDTNFYNISLKMQELSSSENGFWLYVEQAVANSLDKPYRQRLYHVYKNNDTSVASMIYEFKEPKQFIGGNENANAQMELLAIVAKGDVDKNPNVILRDGCTMFLKKSGQKFWGSTNGNGCTSSLRGASYATSEAVITKDGLVTLDRGYDANGKQVWGSQFGGYQFMRQ